MKAKGLFAPLGLLSIFLLAAGGLVLPWVLDGSTWDEFVAATEVLAAATLLVGLATATHVIARARGLETRAR